jgi:Bacterial Ig-like domain
MMRAYVAAVGLAAFLLVSPFVANAGPGDKFDASISPSVVNSAASRSYTIAITNAGSSPDAASAGSISIPTGFAVSTAQATIVPNQSCDGTWTAVVTASTIDLAAQDSGSYLCPRATLAVTFDVTDAPAADGDYQWNTSLSGFQGPNQPPTLAIDSTPPAVVISTPFPPLTDASASFSFATSDANGIAAIECRLTGIDETSFGPCTSSTTMSFSGLNSGQHTLEIRASDVVGNVGSDSASWMVDATAPPAPVITSAPSDPSGDSSWTFLYTDGDPTAHLFCQLDGGPFTSCPSGFPTGTLLDGQHTFGVKAVDDAGNASGVTTYTWTIDTVHPLVSITSAPPLLTNQTSATFSFVANKPGSTYQCALDGGAFGSCSSPRLYNNLSNGSHTFAVRGVWLTLVGPATEYTWRVDTVPPQTTITSTPPADSHSRTATFAFTSGEANSTFTCRLNTAGLTPCTTPHAYTGLGDGTYTFRVQAVDAAGNADTTPAVYTWKISGVGPPTADLKPPANVGKLKRNVGYGRMQLRWRRPADSDFDHVNVYLSTSRKTPPRRLVYTGKHQSYTDRHFKNGQYYRFLVVSYDRAKNASGGRSVLVPPSALLTLPRNGSTVRGVPKFRWAAVRRASFYNMQVYLKGQKILSTWPGKARQSLTRKWWYGGRRYTLRRGLYVWYVWPGFGPRTKGRYGQLLGQGSFKVR